MKVIKTYKEHKMVFDTSSPEQFRLFHGETEGLIVLNIAQKVGTKEFLCNFFGEKHLFFEDMGESSYHLLPDEETLLSDIQTLSKNLARCTQRMTLCRGYLMGVKPNELTAADVLERLGYGRDGKTEEL